MDKFINIAKQIVIDVIGDRDISVFIYGSRASENYRRDSDLDIGLLGKDRINKRIITEIKDKLEESIVPYHVDVTDFNDVSEKFRNIALKNIDVWKNKKYLKTN